MKISKRTLVFGAGGLEEAWTRTWPLPAGTYKAIMARETGAPYTAIVESEAFTVNPRPVPSPAPTRSQELPGMTTAISTDSPKYFLGEDIIVSFQNENPRIGDFVAIYESSADSSQLANGEMWMWVCGGKNACSSSVSMQRSSYKSMNSKAAFLMYFYCLDLGGRRNSCFWGRRVRRKMGTVLAVAWRHVQSSLGS